jgi:hypothetical protein
VLLSTGGTVGHGGVFDNIFSEDGTMITTTAFRAMQQQAQQRQEKEQQRRDALYAKRPQWAAEAAFDGERQRTLAKIQEEIAELEAAHAGAMEELSAARRSASQDVNASVNAIRLLVETAPPFLANPMRMYRGRLESAQAVIDGPEPEPPSAIAGLHDGQSAPAFSSSTRGGLVPGDELRAGYQRRLNEHRDKVNRCRATVEKLNPLVDRLWALAMKPDPTEEELATILAHHEGEQREASAASA